MGEFIGNEIIQTINWIEDIKPPLPQLNFKHVFPKTVFEAVNVDFKEDSLNLKEVLDKVEEELRSKQPMFPNRPANFLMTYAGVPGAVGSIEITTDIPWDLDLQSNAKIPTEKAIGGLLYKMGLLDENGDPIEPGQVRINWTNIIGRPKIYHALGYNEDGFIVQKVVTDAIDDVNTLIGIEKGNIETVITDLNNHIAKTDDHITNILNPHEVTIDQLDGINSTVFEAHTSDVANPHEVTATQVGLSSVDNTRDMNKPISIAVQEALDIINNIILNLDGDLNDLEYITNATYDQPSGRLIFEYRNGSTIVLNIPIDGLVRSGSYSPGNKSFTLTSLNGTESSIDLSDLYIRYLGSDNASISISIDGDQSTGNQTIRATINTSSITSDMIQDESITESKLTDNSVTSRTIQYRNITNDKMADDSINTRNIVNNSITTGKINPSTNSNVVLATVDASTTPKWVRVSSKMISDDAVLTNHIKDLNVTQGKIQNDSISTDKLIDSSVTTDKISPLSIDGSKIISGAIGGDKLISDISLPGTPTIGIRPIETSDDTSIPDTMWVNNRIGNSILDNSNLTDRSVDGRVLFTSPNPNKVLTVIREGTNPVWGNINNDMLEESSVSNKNIINNAVTSDKIADRSIAERHLTLHAVQESHIADNVVTSTKIWPSITANLVLASIKDNGNPVYTKVNKEMISHNAIGTQHIQDKSISLSKIVSSDTSSRVLAVTYKGMDPTWTQVTNNMLADRSVHGRNIFTGNETNRVLGINPENSDPAWLQISGEMVHDRTINRVHIKGGAIYREHLQEKIIEGIHIADNTITTEQMSPRSITGDELFTSPIDNRILAVNTAYSNPMYMQLITDMVEDTAITGNKLWRSDYDYRVIGATNPDAPAEYLKITGDFVVDYSLDWIKMKTNPVFFGVATTTGRPEMDADDKQVPDTHWVRETVKQMVENFDLLETVVTTEMLQDKSVTGSKLFTSDVGPRVLGITHANEDPEYLLIEESLIVNSAVTSKKIARDIYLYGAPAIEIRPRIHSSDDFGGGDLIPDCQWVIDRIVDASTGGGIFTGSIPAIKNRISKLEEVVGKGLFENIDPEPDPDPPGPGGGELTDDSVMTRHIQNRAVTGNKLFTSPIDNRILAVLDGNDSPKYTQINNSMMLDESIDGRTLFKSLEDNRILGVTNASGKPEWLQIQHGMIGPDSIDESNLRNNSVSSSIIKDGSVTQSHLALEPMINTQRLIDKSVTNDKYADKSITSSKIAIGTIKGENIANDVILPKNATISSNNNYTTKSLRNIFISKDAPSNTDGEDGDIWVRYV